MRTQPLLPGLSTLGSVNYFLALLIKCYTSTYGRAAQYWRMQVRTEQHPLAEPGY